MGFTYISINRKFNKENIQIKVNKQQENTHQISKKDRENSPALSMADGSSLKNKSFPK